jgi:predicted nucleotidyltransferase component of viral defense system
MTMIDSAKNLGFSEEAQARDRCQMQFLAQLMRQGADRFVLKGGMAMRALYGSARLTKDIDFDCEDSVSAQSMKAQMPKALEQAARATGLIGITVKQTKAGDLANKWRLDGRLQAGQPITFDVEVSRRGVPGETYVTTKTVQAPYDYRIPVFVVRVYTAEAMAAGKVNALLSENRSVPRDVYDLFDFVQQGVDPSSLWIAHVPREVLQRKRSAVWAKVDGIVFDLANAELLPYIPPALRATIDERKWDHMRTEVANRVDVWLDTAIAQAKPAKEMDRDPQSDADLAGR